MRNSAITWMLPYCKQSRAVPCNWTHNIF